LKDQDFCLDRFFVFVNLIYHINYCHSLWTSNKRSDFNQFSDFAKKLFSVPKSEIQIKDVKQGKNKPTDFPEDN